MRQDGDTTLHFAASGYIDVTKILIRRGVGVSFELENRNSTALHWAAFNGYVDVTKALVLR